MSVARHHAEWLSLVETSGPFVSMPVLLRVFPQGLDGRDPDRAARLREAYEDWLERGATAASVHRSWILHVLTDLLEYPPGLLVEGQAIPPGLEAHLPQQGETLRPDLVLRHSDASAKAQLLITIYPPGQDLAKAVSGRSWNASPGSRMMELLHAADVPLGLVTNGEQWMLVYAPRGETTGFSSWYADLWMQEPITLRAFHSLLHLRRLIGVAAPDTLAALLAESSKDQQEVTDQLGKQVRQAVEVLVQAFDRIDADSKRTLLTGIEEKELYNAALTVMMRLVFLFSAEERGLLPLNDRFYEEDYSASSLRALLRARADQHGEEVLERRHDAWSRLLATFRAVHGGVQHDRLQLPAYGGSLFDPDRYPFLEGRSLGTLWRDTAAKPIPVNNRVVLHLLEALQELRVRVPGGGPAEMRRLSFRALDIEQIGHVYEGLLDHTARRATDVVLGLAGKNEPEIALSKLEELARVGEAKLVEFLVEETGRSAKAISKALQGSEVDEFALQRACGNDSNLVQRLRPFAFLLRDDSFGQSLIVPAGCVYVTSGSDRRSTGTHYTPRSLTEPIVQHTLEPLVYVGPAEGMPSVEWKLKTPKEILALKVCDMAMGSGAFLVQVCRYLSERLVEAWANAERSHPGKVLITPDGELSEAIPSERLIPVDSAERLAIARRYVSDRCLYGVDINPMAVEMAKLSLWLITLQRDRPFTFLDHALKCGDSLLGVSSVQQIEYFSLRPGKPQFTFATAHLPQLVVAASDKRRALEDLPSNDSTQIETKNRLHAEAEAAIAKVKALADCLIAFELRGLDGNAYEEQRAEEAAKVQQLMKRDGDVPLNPQAPTINELSAYGHDQLRGRRTFHWAVEFPEVFACGGFDAFVGNPPFLAGTRLEPVFGSTYRSYLVTEIAKGRRGVRGAADFCCYFFLRISALIRPTAHVSLIATNSISQGDSRVVCLQPLLDSAMEIYWAESSRPWPGVAAIDVALIAFGPSGFAMPKFLNGVEVPFIDSALSPNDPARRDPMSLIECEDRAFEGAKVAGDGFIITPEEADRLMRTSPKSTEVVKRYLNGDDINQSIASRPSQWVINFRGLPLHKSYPSESAAEDFPDCLRIVEARVLPERLKLDDDTAWNRSLKAKWWQFGLWRPAIEKAMRGKEMAFVTSKVTAHHVFVAVSREIVCADSALVVCLSAWSDFAIIQSSIHGAWAHRPGAMTLGTTLRYQPTFAFVTFPFPRINGETASRLSQLGEEYDETRTKAAESFRIAMTDLYNRFHDQGEQSADIAQLRKLHVELDQTVAAAYGWNDLDLGHGFHATKQGERYTLSEFARRTVLDRLLALNHQRYAEEVKAGLHDKGSKKGKAKKSKASPGAAPQAELLPPPQQELF